MKNILQTAYGLDVDGKVGKDTRAIIVYGPGLPNSFSVPKVIKSLKQRRGCSRALPLSIPIGIEDSANFGEAILLKEVFQPRTGEALHEFACN